MKIAYTTTFDLERPESWPRRHLGLYGAGAKIVQMLKTQDTQVLSLGRLTRKRSPITRLKWQFYRKFQQKDFYSWADPIVFRHYGKQIEQQLAKSDADILLCPENAIPLASVQPDRPMVLWTDATLGSLIDFYPYLSNLCNETRHNLISMERRVLERCSLVILTSQWAAQRAFDLYGLPTSKIRIIPRGSNQPHQLSDDAIIAAINQRPRHCCKLLFVGVEWHRKGGDKALAVAQQLHDSGIQTELHIVGCTPPGNLPDFVKVHGFINRAVPKGQKHIAELFQSAHFLILPTRADTFGVVLSEAASYGLPSLASNVGGIASVVRARITGQLFPVESSPGAYCESVKEYVENSEKYRALAHSTFAYYKEHVSWQAAGKQARSAFAQLLT